MPRNCRAAISTLCSPDSTVRRQTGCSSSAIEYGSEILHRLGVMARVTIGQNGKTTTCYRDPPRRIGGALRAIEVLTPAVPFIANLVAIL